MSEKTNKPYVGYPLQQRLCEFLKEEKSKGITLEETAKALKLTRQTLTKYRDGENAPDVVILGCMAEYFGVSTDYLLGRTEHKTTDTNIQAACNYTGLSEKAMNFFLSKKKDGALKKCLNRICEADEFWGIVSYLSAFYYSCKGLTLDGSDAYKEFKENGDVYCEVGKDISELRAAKKFYALVDLLESEAINEAEQEKDGENNG